MSKEQKAATVALIDALKLAMPHLAIAKGRGEGVAYDAAHAALTLARKADLK